MGLQPPDGDEQHVFGLPETLQKKVRLLLNGYSIPADKHKISRVNTLTEEQHSPDWAGVLSTTQLCLEKSL